MKKSSYRMKRQPIARTVALLFLLSLLIVSCKKEEAIQKNGASFYSSEVLDKWITLQLRLMRNTPGITNQGFARPFAYSGIAAFESLKPGLNGSFKWSESWNGLTGLPVAGKAKDYYLPACINAALAAMNRGIFPTATAADKAAIDSLENTLNSEFLASHNAGAVATSNQYGKAVAAAVLAWAEGDGYAGANAPYEVPTGLGFWQPTPPLFSAPATPYWGSIRPVIKGSITGAGAPAPIPYSSDASSPFYNMVKTVYDASQNLNAEQKEMAVFWRDVPGQTSPGHWLSILQSALRKENSSLDEAAAAYALTGSAINDALIVCFASKYQYNLVRPVTYIRNVMGHSSWNAYIGTPAHPEYPSAHASLSGAAADVLQRFFKNPGTITDHTYDYLGFTPRSYASFRAIGEEAGRSRLYAGIHYQQSIEAGLAQGRKVTDNIFSNNSPK
jgi:hypothetical protein